MNAAAYLQSQGWRGKGHTLHPTDNKIGLSKPLLISRNTDGRGIGTKQHYTSDQWWLSAFDQKLKGLDTSKKGTVTQSVTSGKLDSAISAVGTGVYGKYTGTTGLYASFVRGGVLEGSVEVEVLREETGTPTSGQSGSEIETWSERRARRRKEKAEKLKRRAEKVKRKEEEREKKRQERELRKRKGETKEERRERKKERRARKEARRIRREAKEKQKGK